MNDRIALVIKAKNITPSQLADELGVQRSGVSHILNNRNKPSLEFIQKLIKSYPEISTEWMLFGEGPMMKPFLGEQPQITSEKEVDKKPAVAKPIIMELFADDDTEEDIEATEIDESAPENTDQVSNIQAVETQNSVPETPSEISSDKISSASDADKQQNSDASRTKEEKLDKSREIGVAQKKTVISKDDRVVERVIIFYSDKTFTAYNPNKED